MKVVVLACLAVFVVILDATIVAVALATIRTELGFGAAGVGWVVTAYTLAFAGCLLLGGRCADVFGLRPTMLAGLALFGLGSLGAGLAGAPWLLLAARAVQGVGGAVLMPTALASITRTLPEGPRRTRALATWSMVGAVGATAGTLVGGVLTQTVGWRWVFLVNLPVVVVAAVLTVRALGRAGRGGRRLDVPGALLVTAGLTALVYAVVDRSVPPAVAGVALLAWFAVHEHRVAADPLVPLRIFTVSTVRAANLSMFMVGLGFFANPVLLSLYVQGVLGYPPLAAGLSFVPAGVALVVGGKLAGPVTVRLGVRWAAFGGLVLAAAGFAGLAALASTATGYLLAIALPGVAYGLGIGCAFTPLTVAATRDVAAEDGGLAAGLLNTTRQVSGAAGVAALTTLAAAAGFRPAFAVAAGAVVVAAVLAVALLPRENARTAPPARV